MVCGSDSGVKHRMLRKLSLVSDVSWDELRQCMGNSKIKIICFKVFFFTLGEKRYRNNMGFLEMT